MPGTDYTVGEFIRVAISPARVTGTAVDAINIEVSGLAVTVPVGPDTITITRVDPPQWPPQVGDLWADHTGRRWFAVVITKNDGTTETQLLTPTDPTNPQRSVRVRTDHGPMSLVHRTV